MLSKKLIESIECAMPHECPKKMNSSNSCIYCEVGYSFIVKEPLLLECEHNICKECKDHVENKNCKICSKKIEVLNMKNRSTQLLIESNLTKLFENLKDKFNTTLSSFQGLQNVNENAIDTLEQKLKNEIDSRVDTLKRQLDNIRSELLANLKNECDQLKKHSYESKNLSYKSLSTELRTMKQRDYTLENFYKFQNSLRDMMNEIKRYDDREIMSNEIEFEASSVNIELSNLGKLLIKNKNEYQYSFNDDDILLSGGKDGKILFWDSKYKREKILSSFYSNVQTLNGKIIADDFDEIKILDKDTNIVLKTLKSEANDINTIKLINENLLACAYGDGSLIIWDIDKAEIKRHLKGHKGSVYCLEPLSNNRIASDGGDYENSIIIWCTNTGAIEKVLNGHENSVRCLRSINSKFLASGSPDNTIKIWKIHTGVAVKTLKNNSWVECLELVNANHLASGDRNNTVKIWDIEKGCVIRTFEGHIKFVRCLQILSPSRLASGSEDRTIKIWDLSDGKLIKTLRGHKKGVNSITILKSNKREIKQLNETQITCDIQLKVEQSENSGEHVKIKREPSSTLFNEETTSNVTEPDAKKLKLSYYDSAYELLSKCKYESN